MSHLNSQEQTIYRSLAGQIQMGFFSDKERFPYVQEIANRYEVSYCPAQRALKRLEKDGLIKLCRGQETVVLSKPYENYLDSPVFNKRIEALTDIVKSLELISSSISFQSLCHMDINAIQVKMTVENSNMQQTKRLYHLFDYMIRVLGSQLITSLYYDISAFFGSAFFDIINVIYGEEKANLYFRQLTDGILQSLQDYHKSHYDTSKKHLESMNIMFFEIIGQYLEKFHTQSSNQNEDYFIWEPRKGRTKYCDIIAIDMVCKINQGIYPVGTLLPGGDILADIYHVSSITIRRTIELLNKLGVTQTRNGIGTQVVFTGDYTTPYKFKNLMLNDNLRSFLEALQLLAITGEAVIGYTFPYFTAQAMETITQAVDIDGQKGSMVATLSACLQAIVRFCPLAAIREIYGKLTLQLLHGSVLRLSDTGDETVSDWLEISTDFLKSLKIGDCRTFAVTFRRLCENNFHETKQKLLDIDVKGVEQVINPAFFSI